MTEIKNENSQAESEKETEQKRYVLLLITIIPIIAITVIIFVNRDMVAEMGNWGYLGAFLIGLLANATVFMPMPGLLLLFALGVALNPVLVGLIGAVGGALGEMSGYMVGYSGHTFVQNNKTYMMAEEWIRKWRGVAIFMFALVPLLPLDVAGLIAGVSRFPVWKFLVACWCGKAILYICMTLFGAWGWDTILHHFF
jgi:membrane protein DedA with SNARE-associated domain